MVRPRIAPSSSGRNFYFAAAGSIQLLVGPASSSVTGANEGQVFRAGHVVGMLRCRYERGKLFSFRPMKVPSCSIPFTSVSYSCKEPSHHTILAGLVRAAHSSTQCSNDLDNARLLGRKIAQRRRQAPVRDCVLFHSYQVFNSLKCRPAISVLQQTRHPQVHTRYAHAFASDGGCLRVGRNP